MKTWQKVASGLLVLVVVTGPLAYTFKTELILWRVKKRNLPAIAVETPPVNWSRGPAEAAQPVGERPPNVILILADDLGTNDISTFGGGVAGGLVPKPNIDRLAAEGVNFTHG